MNCFLRSLSAIFLVLTTLVVLSPVADAQTAKAAATPVPKVAPLAITADSVPFLAASQSLEPLDLKKFGYVEEEFLVSGAANVYDWAADGTLSVKTPNVPYATRILVRRPADASRFSGNVVVEPLNAVRRIDWSWMWGYIDEQILESGDVWVGITMPGSAAAIKKFNPTRYTAVSFATPTPGVACAGATTPPSDIEDGLRWDAISQVGALLKSNTASGPLPGFRVQAIYMTMGQSPEIMTYINAIHPHATLATGKPVYDGYLVKQPGNPARINQCAPALAPDDARRLFRPTNVPVIALVAQGELLGSLPWRRADSDAPADMFRQYEITGGAHIEWETYKALPSFPQQTAAGLMPPGTPEFPFAAKCEPDIPLKAKPIMSQTFHAALANLEQWVRKGTARTARGTHRGQRRRHATGGGEDRRARQRNRRRSERLHGCPDRDLHPDQHRTWKLPGNGPQDGFRRRPYSNALWRSGEIRGEGRAVGRQTHEGPLADRSRQEANQAGAGSALTGARQTRAPSVRKGPS